MSGVNRESEIDRFVQVDADLLLDAGLVAHDLAGRDAAHGDLALAGAQVLHREPGHVRRHVLDGVDAAVRSTSSVGAATEKGTSCIVSSRLREVTVISSLTTGASSRSLAVLAAGAGWPPGR